MELKEYQKKTLEQVKLYLDALADFKAKNDKAVEIDPEFSINFPLKAWEKVIGKTYFSKKNWTELNTEFDQKIEFQVIFEDEWKAKINKIFGI